jgi:hypothetical protein
MATETSVSYKYILTNLLSNQVIAEVPFVGVTWSRAIKSAGSFTGDIAVTDDTAYLNLYETTMPAKTGLYVMRNDVCVWGGILWSRSYNAKERKLTVSGLEFTSYFSHRKIWKTYTSSFGATLVVPNESGADSTVTLSNDSFGFEAGSDVYISFTGNYINLSSFFKVGNGPTTESFQFDPSNRSYVINKVSLKKSVATFTTKTNHGLSVGDQVTVSGMVLDKKKYPNVAVRMNVTQTVTKIPTNNSFTAKIDVDQGLKATNVKQLGRATFNGSLPPGTYTVTVNCSLDTYEFARRMIDGIATDFTGTKYPNSAIQPGISYSVDINGYGRSGNVVTITTEEPHELYAGQEFRISSLNSDVNGKYSVLEIVDENTVTFISEGEAFPFKSTSSRTSYVTKRNRRDRIITYTTSVAHDFEAGDYVVISNVTGTKQLVKEDKKKPANNVYEQYVYNGTFQVIDTPNSSTFGVRAPEQKVDSKSFETISPSGLATVQPTLLVGSYGPFINNADIGITFEEEFSTATKSPPLIRGDQMQTLNKVLDAYSDDIDGFDYRIDCDYDPASGSFKRVFKFIPRQFPDPPADGEVSPISRFGADKIVFEFPGNVSGVEMSENAENAATRFFTIGSKEGLGDAAFAPHAAAAAQDLLDDGWLLLDEDEKVDSEPNESVLYQWAERYLFESRPPMGEIGISVNGSIDPTVGSYYPGDWCSVIIDDDFIRQRLASGLEPRDNIIVRKIANYSVKVKDAIGVPEDVSITLIPDWEVDGFAK